MKAHLTRRYRLSASHRLHSDAFSVEQNAELYGNCNNPYGHGHNYTVEVTVAGQVDEVTGMVCNLVDLDACVQREVLDRFDHKNLNDVGEFVELVPTTENLCILIYGLLRSSFVQAELVRVRIDETRNNAFEFSEGETP